MIYEFKLSVWELIRERILLKLISYIINVELMFKVLLNRIRVYIVFRKKWLDTQSFFEINVFFKGGIFIKFITSWNPWMSKELNFIVKQNVCNTLNLCVWKQKTILKCNCFGY